MNYEVTRGDTHTFKFRRRNSAGEPVTDTPINIWFTVKNSANSRTILIQMPATAPLSLYSRNGGEWGTYEYIIIG